MEIRFLGHASISIETKGKKIIVDFRPNNYLRIAITPLYTSFDEILKLVVRLVEILDTCEFKLHDNSKEIVT